MQRSKKVKILSIISWVLFGLSSALIIVESATPTDASGQQSFSFSKILSDIINAISPAPEVKTAKPASLSLATSSTTATLRDGEVHKLFEDDEAYVGTTKMFSYTLKYDNVKADVFDSAVKLEFLTSPSENSFTHSLTTSTNGGALRIIPLEEGQYRFRLTDASSHVQEYAFTAKKRGVPMDVDSNVDTLELKAGEYRYYPFAMTFGEMTRDDGSVDHYLARYFDRGLTEFSSSDENVLKIEKGGLLRGISEGTATISYQGTALCNVTVAGTYVSPVASISLSSVSSDIARLDYDYSYGQQLEVHYFDAMNQEVDVDEPVYFYSDDELVAKVDNDHLEIDAEGNFVEKRGGFVSGYRKDGTATVHARLCSDASIEATHDFSSADVLPTDFTLTAKCNGKDVPVSGGTLTAGDTISFGASFEPKNTADTRLHVALYEDANASVINNDTNTPSIHVLGSGDLRFDVYSVALGESKQVSFSVHVDDLPVIPDDKFEDFARFVRKAAGHFGLFFVTGIFGTLAFLTTFFREKRFHVLIGFGISAFSGFFLAGVSELIQAIPALRRGASWTDVGIDTLGFFLAAVIVSLIYFIVKAIRRNRIQEDQENSAS